MDAVQWSVKSWAEVPLAISPSTRVRASKTSCIGMLLVWAWSLAAMEPGLVEQMWSHSCTGVSISAGGGTAAGAIPAVAAVAPAAPVAALAALVLAAPAFGGPVWALVVAAVMEGSDMGH